MAAQRLNTGSAQLTPNHRRSSPPINTGCVGVCINQCNAVRFVVTAQLCFFLTSNIGNVTGFIVNDLKHTLSILSF